MEAKDKAKKLIDKFLKFVDWNDLINDCTNREWAIRNAKQCALIAVDEIIEIFEDTNGYDFRLDFWQEVKEEINKI
jgi:hypothetical protein